MSTPSAIPPPPGTPQVLLFGHTGSGKSALLGALLKAAETQGPTLRGEVLEASGRMASIRDAVYRGDDLKGNDTELTSYTVRLRPWREDGRLVTDPVTVVLHDCSGAAAEGLMEDPGRLRAGREAPVARAVVESDAIVLLVNGAADDEELQAAFEEFDTFLTRVAAGKVAAREVGGMPVLLALTQCDRLARPGDSFAEWEGRVLQRADRAWAKFDAFLKDAEGEEDGPSPFLPFGSIDLTVHPVAVRTPKLPGATAPPATPYAVAELFRDAFASAKARRERVTASDRRLKWTVRLAGAFVVLLLLGVIAMALFPPARGRADLAERVRGYELAEPPAAVRLAYPYLTRNREALTRFRDDRGFSALDPELREFVVGRLKEIDEYEAYRARQAAAVAPGDTRTLEDLAKVEQSLGAELSLPRPAWGETAAAQLREKWRADAAAIRKTEGEFLDRYRDLARRGMVLTLRPSLAENWRAEVAALDDEGGAPPGLADPLPGSVALPQARGEAVPGRVPFEFERVYHARREWDAVRDRLLRLRDLGDALGLTAGPEELRALVLPEPGPGVNSATLPGARLTALLRAFPESSADFREWEVRNFPDPARSVVADRLDRSFRTGARHVQELLRARMTPDTPAGWRATADVLGDPATPFPEWGKLLHVLARLRDPAAANPVGELAAFLRRESFDLDPAEFTVLIPPDLGLDKVAPAGPLTITAGAGTRTFKPVGAGVREGSATRYRFAADGGGKLAYRPGDELRAELPVRVGAADARLVWDAAGSRAYQFDKLAREPRLVKPGGASEPAAGVKLTPAPDAALPRLPVLFPDVRK